MSDLSSYLFVPEGRAPDLESENARLRQENARLRAEVEGLRAENARMTERLASLSEATSIGSGELLPS